MRIVRLIMALLLLAGAVGAYLLGEEQAERRETAVELTRRAVERLSQEVRVRASMPGESVNGRGWPVTVDPSWFGASPPRNQLAQDERPWVEVATGDELELAHPPVRMLVDRGTATFWYNPALGVVRARVPVSISDRKALRQYNRVNGTSIRSLVEPVLPRADADADVDAEGEASAGDADQERKNRAYGVIPVDPERDGAR